MADVQNNTAQMPHLEFSERVWNLPMVKSAWSYSSSTYYKIKDSNPSFNWALNTVEQTVQKALEQAAPIALPIMQSLEAPITKADQTLCSGLDKIETHIPIVTRTPCQVYDDTKQKVHQAIEPTLQKINAAKDLSTQKAKDLRDFSWEKVNQVLESEYGSMAVKGIDNSAVLAQRLLDYYFPLAEGEEEDDSPISQTDNKLLQTVQKIGQLSNKIARRVYRRVSSHIQTLKKEDVKEYIASLVAILHLTQSLQYMNDKVQGITSNQGTSKDTKSSVDDQTKNK